MYEPNFFIVGAPKCGTTALHHYLSGHPQVFMTELKEPHHYCTDLPGCGGFFERRDYLALFAGARAEHVVRGESSVYYLFSEAAIPRILAEHPDAKFVVMVRNPVDLTYALHAQHLTGLNEDVEDFETAWQLQTARAAGRELPASCCEPRLLQYREIGLLGAQLRRALKHVAPEQLHIIIYDDFQRSVPQTYTRVLEFLELPHDGRHEFPIINASKRLRSRWVGHLLDYRQLPPVLRRAGRALGLHRVQQSLAAWNFRAAPRRPLAAHVARNIAATFTEDIQLLSELLHRDLSHWFAREQPQMSYK
jgi:hypothetical protein